MWLSIWLAAAWAGATEPVPQAAPVETGRACFYRTSSPVGIAMKMGITSDGLPVGAISINHYVCSDLPAGDRTIALGVVGGHLLTVLEVANAIGSQTQAGRLVPDGLSGADVLDSEYTVTIAPGETHWLKVAPVMWGSKLIEVSRADFDKVGPKPAKGYTPGAEVDAG